MNNAHAKQAQAQFQAALGFYQSGKYAEAAVACDAALKVQPRHFDALHLAGVLAMLRQDYARAADLLGAALKINRSHAQLHHTYGQALWMLRRPQDALQSFDRAIALKPDFAAAYNIRGNALRDLGRHEDALRSYETAAGLDPNLADAHLHIGLSHLQMGYLAKGWEKFEWHWRLPGKAPRAFPRPQWRGDAPLRGKTILLHDEQGLGDTVQFCRYVKLVADLGATVILGVQRPLMGLLSQLEGVAMVRGWGDDVPPFDFHAPLMSLPRAFKTDLTNIPSPQPYLHSAPEKRAAWEKTLGPKTKPRVGLVWSGAADHGNDINRSIPLEKLAAVLPPGFEYVSLQKEVRETDRAALLARSDIRHFGDALTDFTETAALCDLMDVVISVDTSIAHVAAALGRPTWILISYNPDWRWLLDRDDSPWYASVRLFRQTAFTVWDDALARVREALLRKL